MTVPDPPPRWGKDLVGARHAAGYYERCGQSIFTNEVLAKVLCHNICVLIQAIHELGTEPAFGAEMADARNVAVRRV